MQMRSSRRWAAILDLTDREKAAIVSTAGITFVAGIWVGLWIVPDTALDVPMDSSGRVPHAAYQPVPPYLPIGSAFLTGLALLRAKWYLDPPAGDDVQDADAETVAVDGGEVADGE